MCFPVTIEVGQFDIGLVTAANLTHQPNALVHYHMESNSCSNANRSKTMPVYKHISYDDQARKRLERKCERNLITNCWIWIGGRATTNRGGYRRKTDGVFVKKETTTRYGVTTYKGKRVLVHRLAYFLVYGYWPEKVVQTCNNRRCVNPDHLTLEVKSIRYWPRHSSKPHPSGS